MSRYIDADALIKWINGTECFMDVFKRVTTDIINKQPTVDAVPVVRCRECKRWNRFTRVTLKDERKALCEYRDHIMATRGDFFCSDGERRNDDA